MQANMLQYLDAVVSLCLKAHHHAVKPDLLVLNPRDVAETACRTGQAGQDDSRAAHSTSCACPHLVAFRARDLGSCTLQGRCCPVRPGAARF